MRVFKKIRCRPDTKESMQHDCTDIKYTTGPLRHHRKSEHWDPCATGAGRAQRASQGWAVLLVRALAPCMCSVCENA